MSGRSVALAHRVACGTVAPAQCGDRVAAEAFLLPGLVNGYGKIEHTLRQQAEVLEGIEERLTRIERVLSEAEPSTG